MSEDPEIDPTYRCSIKEKILVDAFFRVGFFVDSRSDVLASFEMSRMSAEVLVCTQYHGIFHLPPPQVFISISGFIYEGGCLRYVLRGGSVSSKSSCTFCVHPGRAETAGNDTQSSYTDAKKNLDEKYYFFVEKSSF